MLIENALEKLEKGIQMRVKEMICKFLYHRIRQDIAQLYALDEVFYNDLSIKPAFA